LDTVAKRLYEGLFLVDSAEAASDWNGINEVITKILDRGQAEVVSMKKWDDRRLAYDMDGKNRGTFILIYFNTAPVNIAGIERDIRLSERIMRAMIIRGEKLTKEDMERATPLERIAAGETPAVAGERDTRHEERSSRY
jgi:small subunit ribosomal protein S6